jgi:hypothetical protein
MCVVVDWSEPCQTNYGFLSQEQRNRAMLQDSTGKGMYHWLLEWYVVMQLGLFAKAPWTRAVQYKQSSYFWNSNLLFIWFIVPLNVQY